MPLNVHDLHPWDVSPKEAVRIQQDLRQKLKFSPLVSTVRTVAGADISYEKATKTCFAAVVVIDLDSSRMVERASHVCECLFPYVPGLLTFREGPALIKAFSLLETRPDAVIFDGQGIAHPRKMGLAAHLGLFLDLPSIGCAKTRLWGEHSEVGNEAGAVVPLMKKGEQLGTVVRTRKNVKPVYVSPGHLIDMDGAVKVVLESGRGYRLPEPVRQAHIMANRLRETYY
jgi:deoxyribonuclease V